MMCIYIHIYLYYYTLCIISYVVYIIQVKISDMIQDLDMRNARLRLKSPRSRFDVVL